MLNAYANHGRWVCDCPRCNSAELVKPFGGPVRMAVFQCSECGHSDGIAWPEKIIPIEIALTRRRFLGWRNWRPGQTVRQLLEEEPRLHHSWTAPATWVAGAVLTAGQLNTHLRDNMLETYPAKVTTQADIAYATGANSLTRLPKGTAYQALRMNSAATALEWTSAYPRVLKVDTADVTWNNDATEKQLHTYTVAGGTLGSNNVIEVTYIIGIASTATPVFTLRVKYGSSMVLTPLNLANGSGTINGFLRVILKGDGSANAQRMQGEGVMSGSASGGTTMGATITGTEASGGDLALVFTGQMGAAGINSYIYFRGAIIRFYPNQ